MGSIQKKFNKQRKGREGGGVSEDIGYFFDKKKGIFRFVTP